MESAAPAARWFPWLTIAGKRLSGWIVIDLAAAGKAEGCQQACEAGDLGGPVRHPQLGDGLPGTGDSGEQVRGRSSIGARAAD
ncbi:hypothetical protein [Streptomyces sp. NPDC001719]